MASCAILELRAKIESWVSSEEVSRVMSAVFIMGDLPMLVRAMVAAPRVLAIFMASTMSFEEPEWETPTARSPGFRWEAAIACMWLSV